MYVCIYVCIYMYVCSPDQLSTEQDDTIKISTASIWSKPKHHFCCVMPDFNITFVVSTLNESNRIITSVVSFVKI